MRKKIKILVIILTTIVLYNEFISYSLQKYLKWPILGCDSSNCMKILFVADPQILGEQYESGFLKGRCSRWDSDRYLSKTFYEAVSHIDPDMVIFLGDIMDEGSIATADEYQRYTQRFFSIFNAHVNINKFVFLPGDNDIGGENEPLTPEKIQQYQETFNQPEIIQFKLINLFKVNRLTYTIPQFERSSLHVLDNKTQIVISHLPLLFSPSEFVKQVVTQLHPHAIFSAHDHKSLHISVNTDTSEEVLAEILSPSGGPVYKFELNTGILHEIAVPTCSYRMGVYDTGYGVAVIDNEHQNMLYAVLWLPNRFTHLFIYIGALVISCAFFGLTVCRYMFNIVKCRTRRSKCIV